MGKTIAITGAGGFIGKALVQYLHQRNYTIIALQRCLPIHPIEGVQYLLYNLSDKPEVSVFKNVDVLIHLAFEFKEVVINGVDVNLYASIELKKLNIPVNIFLSSFAAASPVTNSYYGRCKFQLESLFKDDIVIQPALVLGDGGLFGKMKLQLKKSSMLPLLNGGNQIIQTISINDLLLTIAYLINNPSSGIYPVAHPQPITYKELMLQMANHLSKKIVFIPIPLWVMRLIVTGLQWLPNPPINKDNLEGLLMSKHIDTSHLQKQLNLHWLTPTEAIEKL
jgi:NAD dependent epimerase/dehydratase family enzyme